MRKIIALAAAAAAVATTALVGAGPAEAVGPGCYRPVYTNAVYQYTGSEDPNSTLRSLSPAQFQARCGGNAVVINGNAFDENGDPLNIYYKYAFLNDIVGETAYTTEGPYSVNSVPYDLWVQAGRPQPVVVDQALDLVYNLASNPSAIYLQVGDTAHQLDYDQWTSLGQPAPTTIGTIEKYPFTGDLYFTAYGNNGAPAQSFYLDGADWASFDYAPPQVTTAIYGDLVYRFQGEDGIYLRFPDRFYSQLLSYNQWTSIGQRAPVVYGPVDKAPRQAPAHGTPGAAAAKVIGRLDLS